MPHSTGSEYVNTTSMEGGRDVRAAFGANFERLQALKDRYDPTNMFRLNHNIQPRTWARATSPREPQAGVRTTSIKPGA